MKTVSETLHLQRRNNVWHYYRRTPDNLVPIVGRRFFKHSLKTSNLAEAKKLRTVEDLKLDALFEAALESHKTNSASMPEHKASVSLGMLIDYVRKHVSEADRRSAEEFVADPPNQEERRELWVNSDIERSVLMNPEDPNRGCWIASMKHRVLAEAATTVDDPTLDAQFAEIVRRGLLEITRRRLDRYEDRHDRKYLDKLFDPEIKPSMSFRQLKDVFVAEKSEEYEINGVSRKRLDKVTAIADCLCEAIGETLPVAEIDDDRVQHVRSLIAKCPSNRLKVYPKLSLEDAVERAAKEKKATLSPTTQAVYLDTLRDILKVGVRKKLLASNPAADLRPVKKDTVPAHQKRFP
jgi:hypothetical protein